MTARVLTIDVLDELRGIVREPAGLFFLVAMPVGFFALFVSLWGGEDASGLPAGTAMLATLGTFGVVGATLRHPGIGVAEDRERGWLRAKRVSAVPVWAFLGAKLLASIPIGAGVLAAMSGVAVLSGNFVADGGTWLRLLVVLVLGALPFALTGLAVGLVASPQTTTAVLNALLIPSAVASGLWMPLELLPELVQRVAPALPTYHLAQLGLAQLSGGGGAARHLLALLAWALAAAIVAGVAYGRSRP